MTEDTTPDPEPDAEDLAWELHTLSASLSAFEQRLASGVTTAAAQTVRRLRGYADEAVLIADRLAGNTAAAPNTDAPEAPRTTPAANRVLAVRQALADELAAMGIATSQGADGHAVRRLASAVLRALDGDPS